MSESVATTVAHKLDNALDEVKRELKHATEAMGGNAEETFSRASEALNRAAHALAVEAQTRGKQVAKAVSGEVKQHPVATAAAIATAAAALVGLVVAARRHKTDGLSPQP